MDVPVYELIRSIPVILDRLLVQIWEHRQKQKPQENPSALKPVEMILELVPDQTPDWYQQQRIKAASLGPTDRKHFLLNIVAEKKAEAFASAHVENYAAAYAYAYAEANADAGARMYGTLIFDPTDLDEEYDKGVSFLREMPEKKTLMEYYVRHYRYELFAAWNPAFTEDSPKNTA